MYGVTAGQCALWGVLGLPGLPSLRATISSSHNGHRCPQTWPSIPSGQERPPGPQDSISDKKLLAALSWEELRATRHDTGALGAQVPKAVCGHGGRVI